MVEKVETKTCDSVEECGEVVDPPYYYDWTNKPSGLYTVNNIFALQTTIIGIIFAGESYLKADVLVKTKDATKGATTKDMYDYMENPKDDTNKAL